MNSEPNTELSRVILSLKRRMRVLTGILVCLFAAAVIVAILGPPGFRGGQAIPLYENGILRVRGVSVVDGNGTERVRIGAPIVEPLVLGKRFPRGGSMSGILLFDEEGNERSGYCTSDGYPNVLFTLDSLKQQHVLFLAEPQGDTALWIWNGGNSFKLSVGEDGSSLKIMQGDKPLLEVPAGPSNGVGEAR